MVEVSLCSRCERYIRSAELTHGRAVQDLRGGDARFGASCAGAVEAYGSKSVASSRKFAIALVQRKLQQFSY